MVARWECDENSGLIYGWKMLALIKTNTAVDDLVAEAVARVDAARLGLPQA